jgi:ribose transport system permease protein
LVASSAGVLLASNLGSVSASLGQEYLLPAFAAAFLGASLLKPGRFNIWGTMLAVFLLGTGVQGIQLAAERSGSPFSSRVALIVEVGTVLLVRRIQIAARAENRLTCYAPGRKTCASRRLPVLTSVAHTPGV